MLADRPSAKEKIVKCLWMPYMNEEHRRQLNAWLARFAPLVMEPGPEEALDERQIEHRLQVLRELRAAAEGLSEVSPDLADPDDQELVETFRKATNQLESIEDDLRTQLARFSPGHPEGMVDLDELQLRLAQREAKQEIGMPTGVGVPEVLELQTQSPNMAKAGGLGCMATGVTAFTLFHATFMIGGMFKVFGVLALALVFFYAIFWFFCYKMYQAAKTAASEERIEMNGNRLKVTRTFLGKPIESLHQINLSVPAVVSQSQTFSNSQNNAPASTAVMLTDLEGKAIELAVNSPAPMQQQIADRLNAYMRVKRNQTL